MASIGATSVEQALAGGVEFLLAQQGRDGLWRDFETLAGEASDWPTGFVGTQLLDAGVRGAPIDRAAEALLARQHRDGGWGYHHDVPSDADSTAWVLMFLAAIGTRAPSDGASGPLPRTTSGPALGRRRDLRGSRADPAIHASGASRRRKRLVRAPSRGDRDSRSGVRRCPRRPLPPGGGPRLAVCRAPSGRGRRLGLLLVGRPPLSDAASGRLAECPRASRACGAGRRVGAV